MTAAVGGVSLLNSSSPIDKTLHFCYIKFTIKAIENPDRHENAFPKGSRRRSDLGFSVPSIDIEFS